MKRQALDIYDEMPKAMRVYLSQYGYHFNKKAFEAAVHGMKKRNPSTGKEEQIEPWTKEQVDQLLAKYGVQLENNIMYDATYVANMAKADYLKSSLMDEARLAMYVKDTLDDVDGCDELPFRFWLQKMVAMGVPIDFEDLL